MPVSTAEKLANNESAIVEFRITRIAEWTKRKERAIVPVSEAKLFSTGLRLIFFLNKKLLGGFEPSVLTKRTKLATESKTNAEARNICLGNGKKGCRARPATPTTPTKNPKQPLQQLTADQISKVQLR